MKTKFKYAVGILSATVILSACSKNENVKVAKSDLPESKSLSYIKGVDTRMFWQFDPWRWTCLPIKGNCAPVDVVIVASSIESDLINTVETGTSDGIIDFFDLNSSALSVTIPQYLIDGVVDGTYTVEVQDSTDPTPGSKYLIFKDSNGDIEMVIPYIPD